MLTKHLRDKPQCENRTPSPDEEVIHITLSQERDLRKKRQNITEEERWLSCFRTIFPDIPID